MRLQSNEQDAQDGAAPRLPGSRSRNHLSGSKKALYASVYLAIAMPLFSGPDARSRSVVLDQIHELPPSEWKFVDVQVEKPGSMVIGEFEVIEGGDDLRLLLLRREDLDATAGPKSLQKLALARTGWSSEGRLMENVQPGTYAVMIENGGGSNSPSRVAFRIWTESQRVATELPTSRRILINLMSGAFLGVALLTLYRTLGPALKQRNIKD